MLQQDLFQVQKYPGKIQESQNKTKLQKNIKDIVGQTFGTLTVVSFNSFKRNGAFWNCKCSCGNLCTVRETYLRNDIKKDCGGASHRQKKKETWKTKAINMRYGKLTVFKYIGTNQWGKFLFECMCDCGVSTTANISELKRGTKKSCGCLAKEYRGSGARKLELIGNVFGRLTVVGECGKTRAGDIIWLCKCECGGEVKKKATYLSAGLATHCGCQKPVKIKVPGKIKLKKINKKELAQDLYCWLCDGVSVVDIAIEHEYSRGSAITMLFNKFIPGYQSESAKRRKESLYNKSQKKYKKRSKIFRYEKDFNDYCFNVLKNKGVFCEQNERQSTGFEVDIKTKTHCYELKVVSKKKDLFTAFGQLIINSQLSGLKPVLLIPSDIDIHDDMAPMFRMNDIEIKTEKEL